MAVRTNLLLPQDLVERVDRVAGERGRSRFVADVLERELRRLDQRDAVRDASGWLRDRPGYDHWSTSDRVVKWVESLRSEPRSEPVGPAE